MTQPQRHNESEVEDTTEPSREWAESAVVLVHDKTEEHIMPNGDPSSLMLWGEDA